MPALASLRIISFQPSLPVLHQSTITLLSSLLNASAEFKEQLVQTHGFHVLGSCLADLPGDWKRHYVDERLIQVRSYPFPRVSLMAPATQP